METSTSESLDRYLHESGCREISVEQISDDEGEVAVIVMERFQLSQNESADTSSLDSFLDPIRQPVQHAIQVAVGREEATWGLIASRFVGPKARRITLATLAGLAALVLAACVYPTTLRIPAGRTVGCHTSQSSLRACRGNCCRGIGA